MSKQSEAGKGSAPRKKQDQDAYIENYSKIFSGGWLERKKAQELAEKNASETHQNSSGQL